MYPKRRRSCAVTGAPFQSTSPESGARTPTTIRIAVVLPAPLAPMKPVRTPGRTANPTPSRASTGPNPRVSERSSSMVPTLRSGGTGRRPPGVGRLVLRREDLRDVAGLHQAGLVGEDDRLDAVAQVELEQNPRHVRLDG